MKKLIIIISALVLILIAALTICTAAYTKTDDYRSNVLPDNTTINGVDCSKLTYDEAADQLTDGWNSRHITVTGDLNEILADYTDFGCTYDAKKRISKIKHNYLVFAAANHFFHTAISAHVPMVIKDYDENFKKEVVSSDFLNDSDAVKCKNAYVDLNDPSFPIIDEVYGTQVDTERFFNNLLGTIQTGEVNIVFNKKDYYDVPEITSESEELHDFRKFCRKFLKQQITYDLGDSTFTLTAEQLYGLMDDDLSGNPDEEKIKAYVNQLADTYDNIGVARSFTSFSGKEINVKGGSYGWEIDREKEISALTADINSHKDVTREPVFSEKGYGKYAKVMGDTYIDVDISNQRVVFYQNGKSIFSSPCVTGCVVAGHSTYTGTFYVVNKVTNVVLRGDNGDGTRYESPVRFWMGIFGGQGFHDANWRGSFGGSIYYRGGSHGCVNMPPSAMPSFYRSAEVGVPVVIHH